MLWKERSNKVFGAAVYLLLIYIVAVSTVLILLTPFCFCTYEQPQPKQPQQYRGVPNDWIRHEGRDESSVQQCECGDEGVIWDPRNGCGEKKRKLSAF